MPASIKHLTDKKLNLTSLLARWEDGLYYTAAIVKCDKTKKKCLVCFEDGSEVWVNNRDVHIQLTLDQLNEDEDIVCCICDDGNSEPPNEIILCDVCQQGYHQKCHNPPVDSSKIDGSEDTSDHKDWFCATCSYILNQSDRAKLGANAQQQPQQQPQAQPKSKPTPTQVKQPQPVTQPRPVVKQSKQVPVIPITHHAAIKTTVGPVKTAVQPVQKPAPYYPLSNQARAAATSSTAALASMTASSALVVGSSAGRTKQDLVNQSNRSSQRRQQQQSGNNVSVEVITPPVKHAVRKSSVNFSMPPVRQSALPTATRSVLPSVAAPTKVPHLIATSVVSTAAQATQPPQLQPNQIGKVSPNNASDSSKAIKQQQAVPPFARSVIQARPVITSDQASTTQTGQALFVVGSVASNNQSGANAKSISISQSSNPTSVITNDNSKTVSDNSATGLDGNNKTSNPTSSSPSDALNRPGGVRTVSATVITSAAELKH